MAKSLVNIFLTVLIAVNGFPFTIQDQTVTIIEECQHDSDCPVGSYCLEKLDHKICEFCFDCERRANRYNSTRTKCAKRWTECGDCLPNFVEELLTGGNVRDKCIHQPTIVSTTETLTSVEPASPGLDFTVVGPAVLGTVLVVGIVIFAFCTYRQWRKTSSRQNNHQPIDNEAQSGVESLPPSYETAVRQRLLDEPVQEINEERPEDSDDTMIHVVQVQGEGHQKTEADPFNVGGYQCHLPGSQDVPQDRFELEAEVEVTMDEHDEGRVSPAESINSISTEPSHWQPHQEGQFAVESGLSDIEEEVAQEDGVLDEAAAPGLEESSEEEEEEAELNGHFQRRSYLTLDSGLGNNEITLSTDTLQSPSPPSPFPYVESEYELDVLNSPATSLRGVPVRETTSHPSPRLANSTIDLHTRPCDESNQSSVTGLPQDSKNLKRKAGEDKSTQDSKPGKAFKAD